MFMRRIGPKFLLRRPYAAPLFFQIRTKVVSVPEITPVVSLHKYIILATGELLGIGR